MVENGRNLNGKEPKHWYSIQPTPMVAEILSGLNEGTIARRHMQALPPGRFFYFAQFAAPLSGIMVEHEGHETVPMIRVISRTYETEPERKILELYGPAYIKNSEPVRTVTGLGELHTYIGCSLFVPQVDIPMPVLNMLLHAYKDERYKNARSLNVKNDGTLFVVE